MSDVLSDVLSDDEWFDASPQRRRERLWPLDLAIVSVAGLVVYVVCSQLRFDDPRWQYNAGTYAMAIPVIALAVALLMRNLTGGYLRKSIQLGFLVSVFLHLTLLLVAIRWVIFPAYFPEALLGNKSIRTPVRKTISEFVFNHPTPTAGVPDWARPVDAETASRIVPEAVPVLPPMERSAASVQAPVPPTPATTQPLSMIRRAETGDVLPTPADAASQLSRRTTRQDAPSRDAMSAPVAPELAVVRPTETDPGERADAAAPRPDAREAGRSSIASLPQRQPEFSSPPAASPPQPLPRRTRAVDLPTIDADAGRRQVKSRSLANLPAADAPPAPTVPIAKLLADDSKMLSPRPSELSETQRSDSRSASLADLNVNVTSPLADSIDLLSRGYARSDQASAGSPTDVPVIGDAGIDAPRSPARRGSPSSMAGNSPAGAEISLPDLPGGAAAGVVADAAPRQPGMIGPAGDRDAAIRPAAGTSAGDAPLAIDAGRMLDVLAPTAPAGLAIDRVAAAGVITDGDQPRIASLDLNVDRRPRRNVGGAPPPAGSVVAAVEPFDRRLQRTQGGAAPTPAGLVGPETEEAIELGLAFLAERQNDDGSWSLQGHGEDVLLRSDTAATGLCLLAFQGAGYTHKQHQYASVVAKGLQHLISVQRDNGDLFRAEDAFSNRNVAFYSHGIAALAMSEAYGMTKDESLRGPAQAALDYITATQHAKLGGWRYTPQVSSDTSVSGWMMMALKSGELSGLKVDPKTYIGINRWLSFARQSEDREDRYRYDPFAPDTPTQRHGRFVTPTMTAVGMLMRMYTGWRRDRDEMKSAAEYLLQYPPEIGTTQSPQRDTYYWYYATQVMFHMGGDYWERWNRSLKPALLEDQIKRGDQAGSWDPVLPVADRWSPHGGRLYVTTMNLLNLEVYYRHLPIYDETAQ